MQKSTRKEETRFATILRKNNLEDADQALKFADFTLRYYFSRLRALARKIGVAEADLDDCAQETILVCFAVIAHQFGDNRPEIVRLVPRQKKRKDETKGRPWIVTLETETPIWTLLHGVLSKRIGRNFSRESATRIARWSDKNPEELLDDEALSPEAGAALHQQADRLGAAVGRLSDDERRLFLAALRGKFTQEAKKSGKSPANAYRIRSSAIRSVRDSLSKDHMNGPP